MLGTPDTLHDITATVRLSNGVRMPRLGLGTYKAQQGGDVEREVSAALETGYRSIDTASLYENEEGIASAIRTSGIPRTELFITSKVWNSEQGYNSTFRAFDRSLKRLGTDYLDLYLVHWPRPETPETWRAIERLYAEGMVRAIGVCNHLQHHLEDLISRAEVVPMVDQYEFHPWLQQPSLREYCFAHDIVPEAWAPVMKGHVGEVAELVEIGRRHSKSPAQVAIRWILQHGMVTIPKSVHAERVRENAEVFDFALSAEEMATIDGLDRGYRFGPEPDRGGVR
jgi:diketogulonate reductase-like aldo/keto reductase